jgi:hypothetical protein
MSAFGIELSDRSLALARDGRVVSAAPSAVFDGSGIEPAGASAWKALRRQPTSTSTRHSSAVLSDSGSSSRATALLTAELSRRLAEDVPPTGERVWIAAPVRVDARGLGTALGIARELSLQVDGFVDAATASVAALGLEKDAVVLELGLHHLAATAVESDGQQARRRRAILGDRGGLVELYEAWLKLISTAMVKRTRFDPLHVADTEQQLFDAVPALITEVAATGSAMAAVDVAGTRHEVSLSRDQLAESAQPVYREMLRVLHALRPAGATVSVVVPQIVAGLPGLRESFEQFVGCELIAVADGFAAAATSVLTLPEASEGQSVRLLRRLPSRAHPVLEPLVTRQSLGQQQLAANAAPASHVLFEGRAHLLGEHPLIVGRAPQSTPSIELPEGLAGVSRRHCTLVRNGGELLLVDHSQFGTLVNGERVSERVRVHAGDRIRLGEPGVELALIAVGAAGRAG